MAARAMAQRMHPRHHVTIMLTIIPLTFSAVSRDIDSGCKCTMYDYAYMYCDCCPPQATPGYKFQIDYSYSQWPGSLLYSTCDDGRTSQGCDCIFCGVISNTTHPFYRTCTDMPPKKKDFMHFRTYELNITHSNGPTHNRSYSQSVRADDSIMLPSPPNFKECSSHLDADQNVVVNVAWKPKHVHEQHQTDLIYTVKWHVLGDKENQRVDSTRNKSLRLTGLLPNTLYCISITCRHPTSPYESAPVQKIIVTAERKPQMSPTLLNYRVSSNGCDHQGFCNITLFFQPLALEHQSANCTGYYIEVKGPRVQFNQSANCSDVMVVIGQPLPRNSSYDVTLRYLSRVGPSSPGHLRVPALQDENNLDTLMVIIERNLSHVAVDVKWEPKAWLTAPPTHYGLLYCRVTATDICLESAMQDTLTADDNGSANLQISNPGYDFVYNIAPYWANMTPGLQEQWLCVFDSCGDLLPPEFGLVEVQEEGALSLTLKEAGCTPVQRDRGRPHFYHIELIDESAQVEQKQKVEVFGPVRIKVKGLKADHVYKVKVRSQSSCICSHRRPLCQYSLWTEQRIKTPEKQKEGFIAWIIVAMSALFVIVVTVLAGWSYYLRRNKELRRSLENGRNDKLVSVISATQYEKTRAWLEQNNFLGTDECGKLVSLNPILADSDSGIQDTDSENGGQKYLICQCPTKRKKACFPSDGKTLENGAPGVRIIRISRLSLSSHDSSRRGNNSVPESPPIAEELLKGTCPVSRQNEASPNAPVDGDQPESGITLRTCQVSPVSEPLANHTEKRDPEVQLDNSDRAEAIAKAVQSSDEHQFGQGMTNPKPFIPHAVYVPGISSLSYTDSSSEEEINDSSTTKLKCGPDYAEVRDHAESGLPCDSLDGNSNETFDCSTENHVDDGCVEVTPVVPNLSVLLKFGFPSLENDDSAVVLPWNAEKNAIVQNPAIVTPYKQPDPMPNDPDGSDSKSDGSYDLDSPSDTIQLDIPNLTDKSRNSVDVNQQHIADTANRSSKAVDPIQLDITDLTDKSKSFDAIKLDIANLADKSSTSVDENQLDIAYMADKSSNSVNANQLDIANSGKNISSNDKDASYEQCDKGKSNFPSISFSNSGRSLVDSDDEMYDDDDMEDEDDASLPKPVVKMQKYSLMTVVNDELLSGASK